MKKFLSIGGLVLVGVLKYSPVSADTLNDICTASSMKSLEGIINWATCLLSKSVMPLLFALAVAAFIFGIIQYYLNPENEEKRKKGKEFITGGLIALFVMVSMWGIVSIFTTTFELDNTMPNSTPQFK